MGRPVSGNEKLGVGLGLSTASLPSFILNVEKRLREDRLIGPPVSLPIPAPLGDFLGLTVGAFKNWVASRI